MPIEKHIPFLIESNPTEPQYYCQGLIILSCNVEAVSIDLKLVILRTLKIFILEIGMYFSHTIPTKFT